ncbi:PREDICTED: signal-regulatory protein beta-1 isoform 3 [Chinchilla lanigera]|uniref:signal-regulatory protein beta-1 isoform 3 n=1 Tax=Chinchilla lanigera TaxID=34839 RepID=UPI0006965F50|nr:PREDICTED: signal-regulatory protein beta-1 isoform 3 [Chinchilla lanigera]XP_013367701.1 PREDICTED: signal-regulatory protein beta-1 isoform 3 [Chinchilla lanigera]XP_013367702.1 PREDICTED: signal-regulatory protein beta-1 isoform 3 [Chinchilla lanigera]
MGILMAAYHRISEMVQAAVIALLLESLSFAAGQPFISLTGPSQRIIPEISEPFNCTAGPFSSGHFNVTWFKNSHEHPASAQYWTADSNGTYSVTSKAWVTLTGEDVLSTITCEVAHRDLDEPLRMTMNLSQVLYVIPSLNITKSSETYGHDHQRVNLTCHVSRFYPSRLQLIWMKNGHKILEESPEVTSNPDGTYSLEHMLPEEATLDGSEFACWVVQGDQAPVKAVITAQASTRSKGKMSSIHDNLEGPQQRSEPGTSIQLTYTVFRLHSRSITMTWFKNNHKLQTKPQTKIFSSGDTFNITSTVSVPLDKDDVMSFVHCEVKQKSSLILRKNISLSQYLRVPAEVTVSRSPVSPGLVTITCHVQRFYPENVRITWLEDCHTLKGKEELVSKNNIDGSYTKESSHLVNTSLQRHERVFTCRVQQEEQPSLQASLVLPIALYTTNKSTGSLGQDAPAFIFVAFLLGFKVLFVLSFTVTYIYRWWNL